MVRQSQRQNYGKPKVTKSKSKISAAFGKGKSAKMHVLVNIQNNNAR